MMLKNDFMEMLDWLLAIRLFIRILMILNNIRIYSYIRKLKTEGFFRLIIFLRKTANAQSDHFHQLLITRIALSFFLSIE